MEEKNLQTVADDLISYLDFLRGLGYGVSVSFYDRTLAARIPKLFEYEAHAPHICRYLKSHSKTQKRCIKNKGRLLGAPPKTPYYACCYAGVEEYVVPIIKDGKTLLSVHIGGYRGNFERSHACFSRTKRIAPERFASLYDRLSDSPPPLSEILRISNPLSYIVGELFSVLSRQPRTLSQSDLLYTKTVEYLCENYGLPLTCKEIANALHYSESHLRKVFKEKRSVSVTEFLTRLRLSKAKELLTSSDLSVTEIAMTLGFCDSNYFSTVFKRRFGISPNRYRSKE